MSVQDSEDETMPDETRWRTRAVFTPKVTKSDPLYGLSKWETK